jgi:thiamine-monophosphate kinase
MTLPAEFGLIARHFLPLAGQGGLGLGDDAALLDPPPGRTLVLAADAMVAGVHFLADDPPETLGRKLLRVNLSDLAAMGAVPLAYLMTTAFPRGVTQEWIAAFAGGLALDQAEFGIELLGGDTVVTDGPATFSLTILGHVAPGAALRRVGARVGDEVWVSGSIGDGALGLLALTGRLPEDLHLASRYRLPQPRVSLGLRLAGLARAAGCGAVIEAAAVPLSAPARAALAANPALLPRILTGGDDYELVFAAAPTDSARVLAAAAEAGVAVTRIGVFEAGQGVRVRGPDGHDVTLPSSGWSHF